MGMEIVELDVVDPASLKRAVDHVTTVTGGTLDILVNKSGIGCPMPLLDADLNKVRDMFEVSVIAVVATTQAFAPLLLKSKGMVVNIGSIAGVAPFPWQSTYNASKAAVNILTDTLRIELEPMGVKVVLVVTGSIKTNFFLHDSESHRLPENSIYLPGREKIEFVMSGKSSDKRQSHVQPYAEEVVKNILKSRPNVRPWSGGSVGIIWTVATFCWATVWDMAFAADFGVTKLKKKLKAARAAKGKQV